MLEKPLILATDLDGTLLGGSEPARRRLLEILNNVHANVTVIFVTGRGVESVLPLLSDPRVPTPSYIIADVGSTVVHGHDLMPVLPLQNDIASRWPGSHAVLRALAKMPELERQDVPQERRCSFYVKGSLDPNVQEIARKLGCDVLLSADRYLDLLPGGVSKGSTLTQLAAIAGLDAEHIVVAGDTLNDLSMLQLAYKSIVVGHAEPALVRALADRDNVYIAERAGAGGIIEGLAHHGFLSEQSAIFEERARPDHGEAELVMVYHRQPFDEVQTNTGPIHRAPKSPNGIIPTLLGFFGDDTPGSWIAWSQQASRAPTDFDARVPLPEQPNLTVARIALTAGDVDLFYKRFSKEAFWPIIFNFPDKAEFNHQHWEHYVEINQRFAEQAAREAAPGAVVWVHDYNLWLVPGALRKLRPDLTIAFFHHTAFPPPDVFNIVPWRHEILGSLLSCDYVGFHIPRYVENFVDAVRSHTPIEVLSRQACAPRFRTYGCALGTHDMTTALELSGRVVRMGANPVGVDWPRIEAAMSTEPVVTEIARLTRELEGQLCVLSVERMDYVKGPIEKLLAYEALLEQHPELHGKVTLLNILTPPAPGMEVYESVRSEVDQIIGRIHGRFSTLGWLPVRYFFRSLSYEDVLACYAVADVAWITPLRDGLNLVAKEFIAAKALTYRKGVLVLSEFAGAAVELHGALLTNPYDRADMTRTLHQALTLDCADREHRMRRLTDIVRVGDVRAWGAEFLRAATAHRAHEATPRKTAPRVTPSTPSLQVWAASHA